MAAALNNKRPFSMASVIKRGKRCPFYGKKRTARERIWGWKRSWSPLKAANALCGRFLQQSAEPTMRRALALFLEIKKSGARVGSRPLLSGAPEGIRTSGLPLRSTAYHFVNCSYHTFPCCFFANCAARRQVNLHKFPWNMLPYNGFSNVVLARY